ncbi:uncharacterized protein LOC110731072 [Chenopodium quinoa]|uniref:uncharacterized protein LOC110731072 n=1 Tax=Chenopodium quinoa TaxID=63459 RepID=UPI000B76DA1C|nr:uncharacterized protein LOC110731072 [Chenopodium quinoa]
MTGNGFHVSEGDSCVYSKHDSLGCVIICLYVVDMLIFGTDLDRVNETKQFLSSNFEMKDMGEADVILGVKIKRTSNGICLNQSHYVEKLLKKFDSFNVDPVETPYEPSFHLKKNNGDSVDQLEYARIIGNNSPSTSHQSGSSSPTQSNQAGSDGGQEEGEMMDESNHTVASSIMEIPNPNPPPTPIIIDISSDDEEDEVLFQVEQEPKSPEPMEEEDDPEFDPGSYKQSTDKKDNV